MRVIKLQRFLVVAGFVLSGCAATETQETTSTEQILAAAGFEMRLADSAARVAHLKALTQHKLVPHMHKGEARYVYADAKYCNCVYAGDEAAYQNYQKLALEKQTAEDQLIAVQMNEDAAMDWEMWGARPWRF